MSGNLDKCFEVIYNLVKQGGKLIKGRIWSQKTIHTKSSEIDFVTETDQQVEKLLIAGIKSEFPDHRFIGEESVAEGEKCELTDLPTWIIDPVDGTMNFVHGYPNVCVSVALWINKSPELAIIYNPVLEQMFSARRGRGAFLNGNRIKVSDVKDLSAALISIEFGSSRNPENTKTVLENTQILISKVHGLRCTGSAALNMALVACGSSDANFECGIHAWDMAAGCLIVQEAGGVVLDPSGDEFDVLSRRVLCAASKELADQLTGIIKEYYPERD